MDKTQFIVKFLKSLNLEDCKLQLSGLSRVYKNLTPGDKFDIESFLSDKKDEKLYFCGGVTQSAKGRAGDSDIKKKNYIAFDFDIYEDILDIEEYDKAAVESKASEIIENLYQDRFFSRFSYVVFSGGGIHVYYLGEPIQIDGKEDIELFKSGVASLMDEIEEVAGYPVDRACKNPSRLFRLPGSVNSKREEAVEVEFLEFNPRDCNWLPLVKDRGKARLEEVKQRSHDEVEIETTGHEGGDVFTAIQQVPVGKLTARVKGWEFDGRNFKGPDERGNITEKACFVPEDKNCLVHGGTDHLPGDVDGYSPFTFIKTELDLSDKETFEWFKDNFDHIAKIDKQKKREYKEKQKKKKEKKREQRKKQEAETNEAGNNKDKTNIEITTAADVEDDLFEDFSSDPNNYTWGTTGLNNQLPILERGMFFIIFGQAGSGKTLFSTFLAQQNAKNFDRVVYMSLEMSSKQLLKRHVLQRAGITKAQYRERNFDPSIVAEYLPEMQNINFVGIENNTSYNLLHITAIVQQLEPDLLLIDNLDQIRYEAETELEREKEVVRRILELTRKENVPIGLIHHANKPKTKSKKRFRGLRGLRGSQKIIDDCDFVIEVGRPTPEEIKDDPDLANITSLQVLKDRDFDSRGKVDIALKEGKFQDYLD